VYGTDAYRRRLLASTRRDEVVALAGERAERIAYLFGVTARGPLLAGTYRWARGLPRWPVDGVEVANAGDDPTRDELDALVLMHMANLAEQAHAGDGAPGRWLARVRDLAELLLDSDIVTPPLFIAHLAAFSAADEALTRRAHLEATGDGGEDRANRFALAAATCSVVPEPCVWLAFLCSCRGDGAAARSWSVQAAIRLRRLGAAWDRRLSFEEWLALIEALQRSPDETARRPHDQITHPRVLFEAVAETGATQPTRASAATTADAIVAREAEAGRRRFYRYIDQLSGGDGAQTGSVYPDLHGRPWHNPDGFPLARYLERNHAAIRDEILALDGARFSPESEPIRRRGDWDVVFFYERGRRHDDICLACPVTTRGIDSYPAVRTLAGLIYVSRMRPATDIAAHRGPTNLRVRCHLGVKVPDGDCAIRVGEETRRWQQGRCLVFDDHFEHEAWNHTDEDRIVLIVDLWHPGLSATEVRLLEALHGYTDAHARRLSGYWAANAAGRREAGGEGEAPAGHPSHGPG
jgi:aspartate beta-hydroxylase